VTALPLQSGIDRFWITYTDTNGNDMLDLAEVTATSGYTYNGIFHGLLTKTGAVRGVSVDSEGGGDDMFIFRPAPGERGRGLMGALYNFYVERDIPAVPLPAGMPLLLAGVGALAVLRRRRARG
jgi:hypothetical protein